MFVLATLEHTVKIEPEELEIKFEECIIEKLNNMLSNKIIKNVGLCITFYDFIKIESSFIPQGYPTIYVPVHFRYVVFAFVPGEVIDCFISSSSPEGIKMSTGFFQDIFVPVEKLPEGSQYDSETQMWNWHFKNEETEMVFAMEPNQKMRIAIDSVTYKDVKSGTSENSMIVTAAMNQPGLGSQKWWHDEEE